MNRNRKLRGNGADEVCFGGRKLMRLFPHQLQNADDTVIGAQGHRINRSERVKGAAAKRAAFFRNIWYKARFAGECDLPTKAGWKTTHCPLGKWPALAGPQAAEERLPAEPAEAR